jgi:L-amino acid N-acyltransferase YncA/predicted N-acetyltransferase YhbS
VVVQVRAMSEHDWPQVSAIWAEGIATRNATFEQAPAGWAGFDAGRAGHLRLVAQESGGTPADGPADALLGWAAAGPVSTRRVYSGVMEHSVYVAARARGRGVGLALLNALIAACESTGVWTLRSGIFPENEASLRLHEACGFRRIGVQERVGRRDGRWRDVVQVERRSAVGGDGPLIRLVDQTVGSGEPGAVRRLLAAAHLPTAGLDDAWRTWVADADPVGGTVVGAAALERHAGTFLLRSVVVDAEWRGARLGTRLVTSALVGADLEVGGRARVCLLTELTETADRWFDRVGFSAIERSDLPPEVSASEELKGACPASARAFLRPGR